jgi:hypothetical protein
MKPSDCDVVREANEVLRKTEDLTKAYRKLKRSLKKCADCDFGDGCPAMRQESAAIDAALNQLVDEWGIGLG